MSFILYCVPCLFLTIIKGFLALVFVTVVSRAYKILYGRKNRLPIKPQQVVLITGSTSGIGLAVSKHLYNVGYTVIATYGFDEPGVAELQALAKSSGKTGSGQKQLLLYKLDVRDEKSIKEAYSTVNRFLQENNFKLHGIINNAGVGSLQPFAWMRKPHIRNLMETNLMGTIMLTREFLPLIIQAKGRIVNVSSGLGYFPGSTYVTYGITKVGMIYFTRALNLELDKEYGVKSVCVAPGNLIRQTGICTASLDHVEKSWSQLTDLEQRLYKADFDRHRQRLQPLDVNIMNHQKEIKYPRKTFRLADNNGLLENLKKFIGAFTGENNVLRVEDSGICLCFEDALRLPNPPEHIMAGNDIYNLIVGAVFISLPLNCGNILGSIIAASMYK